MSVIADYKFYVDWNNDGDFSDSTEDITSYVLQAEWTTGYGPPPERIAAGSCRLKLNNGTSVFSSFNTTSPIYGYTYPGRKVKITMAPEGGSHVTQWFGYLETLEPNVGDTKESNTAILTAYGIFAQLNNAVVDMSLQENITTGDAVDTLLDLVDYPADSEGFRDIDTGQTTLLKW